MHSANMAVFCISLISCFPSTLLRYCLSDLEMVPVTPIITGIYFVFTFHMRWISIITTLYLKMFSSYFLITFLSPGIATSINMHVPCFLSQIVMSSLYPGIVLSVCTCWFHNMVTLSSWCALTDFGTWSYSVCCLTLPIIIIQYVCLLSQAFLPGTSLEPAVIPTAQASSFTLQYFP